MSIDPWDKLAHAVTYAIFTILVWRVSGPNRRFILACVLVVLYGGIIEIIQSFTPGRMMSGYDFIANTLGVLIAGLLLWRRTISRQVGAAVGTHRH